MHEKDHLDRMLESALSSYGDPGADHLGKLGLAERILARVSSERGSDHSAPRWRGRFLLWAALPAAACLLLTFLLLKSAGPGATHQSASLPQIASSSTGSKAPGVKSVTTPAPKTVPKTTTRTLHRTFAEVADSAARPKQDVFPLPQPLSPEEQALIAIATAPVASARENLIASQRQLDAPIQISAINIPPLTKPDQGTK
jgi:hypothetical protein